MTLNGKYRSSARVFPVDQAVGMVLAHDITEIRPGEFKGAAFKKGHVVRARDVDHLRRLGKEHLYALDIGYDELHEDDAAIRLAEALTGPGVQFCPSPCEGKISLVSAWEGLLKVNVEALTRFNLIPDVSCATRHNNDTVRAGEIVAQTRAIPLIIQKQVVEEAEKLARDAGPVLLVKKISEIEAGIIITGNEVYTGRIKDKFAPLLIKKLERRHCMVRDTVFCPDDKDDISDKIRRFLEDDVGLILVAGGMSVDPDDVSRLAIAQAGATDIVYGTPVLPGAMFLYGRFGHVSVLGLPACVLHYTATVFDLILPRVLAGERITRKDLASMAHGGLCLNCDACRFPDCPFGR